MYHDGEGIDNDFEAAFFWFKQAADQGFPSAQYNVGVLSREGVGIEKNESLAFEYMLKSANNNVIEGIEDLISMYQNGIGTNQNIEAAKEWKQKLDILNSQSGVSE